MARPSVPLFTALVALTACSALAACTEAERRDAERADGQGGDTSAASGPAPSGPIVITEPALDAGAQTTPADCEANGEPCDCGDAGAGGLSGETICTDAGVRACLCRSPTLCWPGQVLPCDCEDGGTGTAVCAQGATEIGPCACEDHLAEGYRVPDDVACAVRRRCSACHGEPRANDAPMPLQTWEDFHGPTPSQPEVPVYVWLGNRVGRDDPLRMPPPGSRAVSGLERDLLLAWVEDGAPPAPAAPPEPEPGPDPDAPMPTDVVTALQLFCWSCHRDPPSQGAPMALATVEDFRAPSPSDPNVPVYDAVLARMELENGGHAPPFIIAPLTDPWSTSLRAWIERWPNALDCEPLL